MKKYYLTKIVRGKQEFLEISNDDYEKIVSSKKKLFQTLFLEQKFDLVVDNYIEYELDLMKSTTYHIMYSHQNWGYYSSDINNIASTM